MTPHRLTRLTESEQFNRVYRRGTAFRGKLFSVHAFPNETGSSRLGLSVSRKVGSAVVRNTVKRRLREIFKSHQPLITGHSDFVVSARREASSASFEDLSQEFGRAVRKLGVYREIRSDSKGK